MSSKGKKKILIAAALLLFLTVGAIIFYRYTRPRSSPSAGPAQGILSLLPANAPVLAYVDASALKSNSNLSLQTLGKLIMPGSQQDRDYLEFVRGTGFDFTRDLEHAAIAFWPGNFDEANSSNHTSAIAIVDARFDTERIKAYALRTGHVVTVGGHSVYEAPGDRPVSFYFISSSRLELASGNNPTEMMNLDRKNASAMDSAVEARIDRVAGAPIFAVGRTDNLPPDFYSNFRSSPQLLGLIHNIRGIMAAVQPQDNDLYITLDAECSSLQDAMTIGTLLEGLRLFGSSAIADAKKRGQVSADEATLLNLLLSQAQVSPQGTWVRLSLQLSPSMLAGNHAH